MRAREHQPVVFVNTYDALDQRLQRLRWLDSQRRDLQNIGPEFPKATPQFRCLTPGSGHHHTTAMERALLEPIQPFAFGHHCADDNDRRA